MHSHVAVFVARLAVEPAGLVRRGGARREGQLHACTHPALRALLGQVHQQLRGLHVVARLAVQLHSLEVPVSEVM